MNFTNEKLKFEEPRNCKIM